MSIETGSTYALMALAAANAKIAELELRIDVAVAYLDDHGYMSPSERDVAGSILTTMPMPELHVFLEQHPEYKP